MKTNGSLEGVDLSFACQKNYDSMISCGMGKYCTDCHKVVVDFTGKNQEDLTKALEKHGTVCGRFTPGQLTKAEKSRSGILKLMAVNIVIGLGLGSLNNELAAQKYVEADDEGKPITEDIVLGMVIQTAPTYKYGGDVGLQEFLKLNLKFDKDSSEGQLMVAFTVDTMGKVIKPKILKSLSAEADLEAIRVVKMLEFNPGMLRNKKTEVQMILPIRYRREGERE